MATSFQKRVDMGGLTLVVDGLRVGATKPGQGGTELTGTEIALLDGLTAGTVTASKALVVDSNKGLDGLGDLTFTTDTRTDAGAISLTTTVTKVVTTTGTPALTLADGTDGQIKIIAMTVDAGTATLTPTTFLNGTTITFDDAGDTAVLLFTTTLGWVFLAGSATVA